MLEGKNKAAHKINPTMGKLPSKTKRGDNLHATSHLNMWPKNSIQPSISFKNYLALLPQLSLGIISWT